MKWLGFCRSQPNPCVHNATVSHGTTCIWKMGTNATELCLMWKADSWFFPSTWIQGCSSWVTIPFLGGCAAASEETCTSCNTSLPWLLWRGRCNNTVCVPSAPLCLAGTAFPCSPEPPGPSQGQGQAETTSPHKQRKMQEAETAERWLCPMCKAKCKGAIHTSLQSACLQKVESAF